MSQVILPDLDGQTEGNRSAGEVPKISKSGAPPRRGLTINRRYLVTIDREQWARVRRYEIWKKQWWALRTRRADWVQGLGRTVFEVDRASGSCKPLFELPQLLDKRILGQSWRCQDSWTKSITRGLRTLSVLKDGGYVVNDVFGIYETDSTGSVRRYVSLPCFSDLHSAIPNRDNSRLLVTSTGTEEIFEIDWAGRIHRRIHIPTLFDLPPSPAVLEEQAKHGDCRIMHLNHSREFFHVNWAQWIEPGVQMLISLHAPGIVATVSFNRHGNPKIQHSWSYFPHCHGPSLDRKRNSLLIAVSRANTVTEIDLDSGKSIWTAHNIGYAKRVEPINEQIALAVDCNGKRLVELNRNTGEETWSCSLPGLPYSVTVVPHD